jgi:hypothetical protein
MTGLSADADTAKECSLSPDILACIEGVVDHPFALSDRHQPARMLCALRALLRD